jgi:Phage integrase, N-terminal SAM-like domain
MFLDAICTKMETKRKPKFKPNPKLKLMGQVRKVLRYHHYAYRTVQTCCDWIPRYIKFHGGKAHPAQMGETQIAAFSSHLAIHGKVCTSTQRQALNGIVFLYRHLLDSRLKDSEIVPNHFHESVFSRRRRLGSWAFVWKAYDPTAQSGPPRRSFSEGWSILSNSNDTIESNSFSDARYSFADAQLDI